jgi:hypothetical protein
MKKNLIAIAGVLFTSTSLFAIDANGNLSKDNDINFKLELSNVDNNFNNGPIMVNAMATEIATVGISLLPNTWKINLNYSTVVLSEGEQHFQSYDNSTLPKDPAVNSSRKDMEWIEFYTKPIATPYGEFGAGYNSMERSVEGYNTYSTLYNVKNISNLNAFRYIDSVKRYSLTYNILPKDSWYDGFGVGYALEKSNRLTALSSNSIAFKPDVNSNILTVGIFKTFDELKNGFNIQKLVYGMVNNNIEYTDYTSNTTKSMTSTNTLWDAQLTYVFKTKANNKFYGYIRAQERSPDKTGNTYKEDIIALGMIF